MTDTATMPARIFADLEPQWGDGDGNPLVGGPWGDTDVSGRGTAYLREDTTQPKITIDLAGAMEKITPEMLAVLDGSMTDIFMERLKQAEEFFRELYHSVEDSYLMARITAEAERICHPGTPFRP